MRSLCGRDVVVVGAAGGVGLAIGISDAHAPYPKRPLFRKSVHSYIARSLGDRLDEARAAKELAASLPPEELNRVGFRLHERFRPDVSEGAQGWGAKGEWWVGRIVGAAG
jgi:hypothetical protein